MTIQLTDPQARRLRVLGQGLLPPQSEGPDATAAVCRRVCGLQAQDIFAAGLGVRVRSRDATLAAVEHARFTARSVVWTWAMRGTLHLVATEDLDWLFAAIGPVMIAATRGRREQLGLDEEGYTRSLRVARDHLAMVGPSTRMELGAALVKAGRPAGYSIERHLLHRAAFEGIVCMGSDRGSTPTFVLLEDWLGRKPTTVKPETGLSELARRYMAAYAPATPADMAGWSGLSASALRPGWDALADRLSEVTVNGNAAWTPRERLEDLQTPRDADPHIHLLPAFDTYLLGHRSRDLILDPARSERIQAGGIIRPVVLADGAVAGTWQTNRKGRRVNIVVNPFGPLSPQAQAGVAAEVADIERFLAGSDDLRSLS